MSRLAILSVSVLCQKETKAILEKFKTNNVSLEEVQDLLSAYADKTSFTLNMPATGDFFRIKSNDGLRYITTDGAAAGEWQLKTTTGTPDENTIFCFDARTSCRSRPAVAVYLSNNKSRAKLAAYDVATPATVEFGELARRQVQSHLEARQPKGNGLPLAGRSDPR